MITVPILNLDQPILNKAFTRLRVNLLFLTALHKVGDGGFVGLKVWCSLLPSTAALAFQAELAALALLPKLAALALYPVFLKTLSVFSVQV